MTNGGAPTTEKEIEGNDANFEFEFRSGHSEREPLSSADELFADGKIKPLLNSPPMIIFSLRDSIKRRREHKKHEREKSGEKVRGKRSVSPLRVCDIFVEDAEVETREPNSEKLFKSKSLSFSRSFKKWKGMGLSLFRSSSEGRPVEYSVLSKKGKGKDEKGVSFRSKETNEDAMEKERQKRKWKTTLPYKHGLLMGCFGYNLPVTNDMPRRNSVGRA